MILDKSNQLTAVVPTVELVKEELVMEDLLHLVQSLINKMMYNFKKLHLIKILVHLMLVDNYGDKVLQVNRNSQKQLHTKLLTSNKKIKQTQCSHNPLLVERKEWTKIVMMKYLLPPPLNRNNQKPHQWICSIWEVLILSRYQMDLVIC